MTLSYEKILYIIGLRRIVMKQLLLHFLGLLLLSACVSAPEADPAQREETSEETDGVTQDMNLTLRDNEPEELELEEIDHNDPVVIEVVNVGLSQDMNYPPFPEIQLAPSRVDSRGHFLTSLNLRVNNTKFGDNPMNLQFLPDGTCIEKHQQMIYKGEKISFIDLYEYRGSYTYDPQRYRLVLDLREYKEPGEPWSSENSLRVTDYFIINSLGLFDIYFPAGENNWQKQRTEIPLEEENSRYIKRGIRVDENTFTYYQERRNSRANKEEADYQSARQYDIRGKAEDEKGSVYYLEDKILLKNDYVYLYSAPGGIVYRERLGE